MAVLTPIPTALVDAPAPDVVTSGPACSLQRSGSLWQLGIEAQEITASIALLADQLDSDDDATRNAAIAHLESALLSEERNKEALAAKADATCWVIEHLRGQAAYRQQQAKRLTELSRSQAERLIGARGTSRKQKPGWGVTYTARVRVTVTAGGLVPLVREGSGAGHGIDVDLGQAHESALKEAETDAM